VHIPQQRAAMPLFTRRQTVVFVVSGMSKRRARPLSLQQRLLLYHWLRSLLLLHLAYTRAVYEIKSKIKRINSSFNTPIPRQTSTCTAENSHVATVVNSSPRLGEWTGTNRNFTTTTTTSIERVCE